MDNSLKENIPYWAKWIAQDADGHWWAYEVEPLQYHKGWYENELGRNHSLGHEVPIGDWKLSLCSVDTAK